MPDRVKIVRSPDGSEYEVTMEPAPRIKWWVSTPSRWWNTITRSKSWWLTVRNDRYQWPLVRESFRTEGEAEARSRQLVAQLKVGSLRLEKPAFRRRRR